MSRGKEILIIRVDIGDGRKGEIVVHEYDQPDELAKAFCQTHKLDQQICQALISTIDHNIELLIEEQEKNLPVQSEPLQSQQNTVYFSQLEESPKVQQFSENELESILKKYHPDQAKFNRDSPEFSPQQSPSPVENSPPRNKTEAYYQSLKEERMKKIFGLFQPDGNGLISYKNLDLGQFSQKMGDLLGPVIDELRESREEVDFEEFVKGMNYLVEYLTPQDRSFLMAPRKQGNSSNNSPQRRGNTPTYERLVLRKQMRDQKLKLQRQQKLADELRECTFQPNVDRRLEYSRNFK